MRAIFRAALALIMGAAIFFGCHAVSRSASPMRLVQPRYKSTVHTCTGTPTLSRPFFGVALSTVKKSLPAFTHNVTKPQVVEYYVPFTAPFDLSLACYIVDNNEIPFIQIDPRTVSLKAIVAGRYDHLLREEATAISRIHAPIWLSFAHEMNGPWNPWGLGHESPQLFIACWDHVQSFFRQDGNVAWVWSLGGGDWDFARWWPGASHVDMVGMSYYYRHPVGRDSTFAQMVSILQIIHRFTNKPVILAETGVSPRPEQFAQVDNLFRGVKRYGLGGLIWFDTPSLQYWSLNGRDRVIALVRDRVRQLEKTRGG